MLLLPGYKLRDDPIITGDSVLFKVDVPAEDLECPNCGKLMNSNGTKPIDIHDVSQGRAMVKIRVYRKQSVCRLCKAYAVQKLPLVSENHLMTERLVDYIEQISSKRTYYDVAIELGLAPLTVQRVFEETAAARIENMQIETPKVMGIDGIRLGKKKFTVIVNIEMRTLVEILDGHDEDVVSKYFENLRDDQKEKVTCVTMDPWESFRRAVSKTLKCRIVLDRFHAVAMAQNSMEAVRKHLRATAPRGKMSILKGDKRLLLTALDELDPIEAQSLSEILKEFPLAADAHKALNDFREIWEASLKHEGEARLDDWICSLNKDTRKFYKRTAKTITEWKDEALAYFIAKETNAMTESMNKNIRRIFTAANGLSFERLRSKALLSHGAKVTRRIYMKPPLPEPSSRYEVGDKSCSIRFNPDLDCSIPFKSENTDLDADFDNLYNPEWESFPANDQMLLPATQDFGVNPELVARELEAKWIICGPDT